MWLFFTLPNQRQDARLFVFQIHIGPLRLSEVDSSTEAAWFAVDGKLDLLAQAESVREVDRDHVNLVIFHRIMVAWRVGQRLSYPKETWKTFLDYSLDKRNSFSIKDLRHDASLRKLLLRNNLGMLARAVTVPTSQSNCRASLSVKKSSLSGTFFLTLPARINTFSARVGRWLMCYKQFECSFVIL